MRDFRLNFDRLRTMKQICGASFRRHHPALGAKRLLAAIFLSALVAAANSSQATACTPPTFTAEEQVTIPTENIDQTLLSYAITKQTNYYRCQRGLKALDNDTRLVFAAQLQAENMARLKILSHTLPVSGMRSVADRFKAAHVKVRRVRAENVGTEYRMLFGTAAFRIDDAPNCRFTNIETRKPISVHSYGSLAQSAVRNLWNSPSHRKNILNAQINRIGAAAEFTIDDRAPCGTYYYSQSFAG